MWERLRGLRWPREATLYYAACVVLIVIVAALRFYDLPSASLWHDEAAAANNATGTISDVIENTRSKNSSPILWPLGLWAIQNIERSSLSVRIVPAMASVLTVAAIVFLLPRAGVRRSSSLFAGALMAVSSGAISEAQDAREYSLDTLLAVVMLAGTILYLKGKRWVLFIALFLAPFLQYGLVLLGVAAVASIIMKRGLEIRWREWRNSIPGFLLFMALPILALCAGSVMTWFITLRYQFDWTGHGVDNYLTSYYYKGEFTDVFSIVKFVYHRNIGLLEYHLEYIPVAITITLIVAALILSREYRNSILPFALAGSLVVASVAAMLEWYPLIGSRQSLFWGPTIVVAFACAIPALLDRIKEIDIPVPHFLSSKISPSAHLSILTALMGSTVVIIGVSTIIADDSFYADTIKISPVLAEIDQSRNDDDLVLGPAYLGPTISWHSREPYSSYLWCYPGECASILLNLPGEFDGRVWLITHDAVDPYTKEFREAFQVLEPMKIETIIENDTSLFLLYDAKSAAENFINIGEVFPVLDTLSEAILESYPFAVHISDRNLVYIADQCDFPEGSHPMFLHVYPVDVEDLPARSREHGFRNLDFLFSELARDIEGDCAVLRLLPTYPIARIETGQYLVETGEKIWKGVIQGELID